MMYRSIHVIANPMGLRKFPTFGEDLALVTEAIGAHYTMHPTSQTGDAFISAQSALDHGADCLVVAGGDGTAMEVARAAVGNAVPVLAIGCGTANIFAKELLIPPEPAQALELLKSGTSSVRLIDVGLSNNLPLFLRVNFGIFADMISKTPVDDKQSAGQLAYTRTALTEFAQATPHKYQLTLDGKTQTISGVALMIANIGNMGLSGVSLVPTSSPTDGLFDVIVLTEANLKSLLALSASPLGAVNLVDSIHHWQAKDIAVTLESPETTIIDDETYTTSHVEVSLHPEKLAVVVPKTEGP